MNNIFLVCVASLYYKNRIFDLKDPANRDNYWYPNYLLRQKFSARGVSLDTYDYFNKHQHKSYGLIFFDLPKNFARLLKYHNKVDKFLVIGECEVIRPFNWSKKIHEHFKKIFTWNDNIVDNKKYFKTNFSQKIPMDVNFDSSKKKSLCATIIAHKFKSHPLELYTERVKAIRWFEQNHPEDFNLYGIGWDRYYFKDPLSKLNRLKFLTGLLKPKYPSYRGAVESKRPILQKYKFAICYENARDIPGYITEKIFDCFFAGCVPIYWGAPNVTNHIPADTFIDRRKFKSYEELYKYLKDMPEKEYINYLDAIKNFVESDKIYPFSAECFADTLVDKITSDLKI